MGSVIFLFLLMAVMYAVMIRPQQKFPVQIIEQRHPAGLASPGVLKAGDHKRRIRNPDPATFRWRYQPVSPVI